VCICERLSTAAIAWLENITFVHFNVYFGISMNTYIYECTYMNIYIAVAGKGHANVRGCVGVEWVCEGVCVRVCVCVCGCVGGWMCLYGCACV